MQPRSAEEIVLKVLEGCADCDICRYLMDETCLMFPELYRLADRRMADKAAITAADLRRLVDLCTFCALCPCPNIRADLLDAKRRMVDRDGLPPGIRVLEDVEWFGKLCGAMPQITNRLLRSQRIGRLLKAALGIHPDRMLPAFPERGFNSWVRSQGLTRRSRPSGARRVAYFAGCTGRRLFPQVPQAAVEVLRTNEIEVYLPPQKCCGMPALLEGDVTRALEFVRFNVRHLLAAIAAGYEVVCSCPTCGFFFKQILPEGAQYSAEFQQSIGAAENQLKVALDSPTQDLSGRRFAVLQKSLYGRLLKDEGSFSAIGARDRITLAEHTHDLGQYLLMLDQSGQLKPASASPSERLLYYPPCHQREQKIGQPYRVLMERLFGLHLSALEASMDCCGLGGIMGFKKSFHQQSLDLGARLMRKVRDFNPERVVTDCLSCRLQFNQLTPYPVSHPIELIRDGYTANG